jgi:cyanophycinase
MSQVKGYLVAIGGAEDRGQNSNNGKDTILEFTQNGILKTLVELIARKEDPKIEVVTTASSVPDDLAGQYKSAFQKLECLSVGHLKIQSREEADSKKTLERLEKANCIFFSGGDQLKLCSTLGGTQFLKMIKERYEKDRFIIAGTSAGAAAMSSTIISGGQASKGYLKGQVKFSLGFGFIRDVIIDTHFDERGRLARLLQAIAGQPGTLGIGLSEDTGGILEKGYILRAIGSGSVVIVDGSQLTYNNLTELEDNAPITLGNVVLHTLSNSDQFDLQSRELRPVKFEAYEK